jgi:hypothetical protein
MDKQASFPIAPGAQRYAAEPTAEGVMVLYTALMRKTPTPETVAELRLRFAEIAARDVARVDRQARKN